MLRRDSAYVTTTWYIAFDIPYMNSEGSEAERERKQQPDRMCSYACLVVIWLIPKSVETWADMIYIPIFKIPVPKKLYAVDISKNPFFNLGASLDSIDLWE